MAFSTLAEMVQHYESGGDYTAKNPGSTASGAYQFTNSTWKSYATQAGVDTSAYPTAASAPPYLQDKVFQQAVTSNGLRDWTCPGCNPALTSYVSQNPDALALPINTTGSGLPPDGMTTAVSGGVYDIYDQNGHWVGQTTDPTLVAPGETTQPAHGGGTSPAATGTGTDAANAALAATPGAIIEEPATIGLSTGLAQATSSWISGAEAGVSNAFNKGLSAIQGAFGAMFQGITNWFVRAALIFVGVVVLALALWRLLDPDGKAAKVIVQSAGKAAVAA